MQEIWRNSWVVWVGGAWVAVWFEEVGGGGGGDHMVFRRNRRGSAIANRDEGATFGN